MPSRNLDDLEPETHAKVEAWLGGCKAFDVDVLVYCTLRTAEEQAALYRIGRETPGKKVTNAAAWQSWHQYGRAVDAVPMLHGKPQWKYSVESRLWQVFSEQAAMAGLEWAGLWKGFVEFVHVQNPGGMTLAEAYKLAQGVTDA